jgi:hypothetical protein
MTKHNLGETPTEPTEPKIEHTKEGHSIDIFTVEGNFIRTYSEAVHGKDYEKLAKQFVSKNKKVGEFGKITDKPKYEMR